MAVLLLAAACSSGGSDSHPAAASGGSSAAVDEGMRTRATSDDGRLTLETSSTRASLVSGGDVLVTVSGPAVTGDVRLTRDGDDVSTVLAAADGARRGLVTGLPDGDRTLEASAGGSSVSLVVTNHPISGPVLAGPHLEPWVCTTQAAGLGPATDADCSAPTRTTWSYRSTDGSFKDLPDPATRPADLATVSVAGVDRPFVVRTESSVIDRGIASVWVLDPTPGAGGAWDRSGWNERLVYRFGGGCGTQFSQGGSLLVTGGFDPDLLSRGYAVVTNTLDTFQTACNAALSAEAAMMTREHFAEAYGVPRFTIGDGGSGGAIQQLVIANAYPGLLDGLAPSLPFPDAISIANGVTDCRLLADYEATPAGSTLTPEQRLAISGHASAGTCQMWASLFLPAFDPSTGCDASIPASQLWSSTNPDGLRCSVWETNRAVVGTDAGSGHGRQVLDNVGVQYGLGALDAGTITPDQFLDLNAGIGGFDADFRPVPERTAIDDDLAGVAYRGGQVTGPGPLLDVPIIMRNLYTDDIGDIHTRVRAFSLRQRLQVGGTDDPNLSLWTDPRGGASLVDALLGDTGTGNQPIVLLDQWLTAAAEGDASRPVAERLAAAKPAGAANRCRLQDGTVLTGGWELYDDPGPCRDAYPVHGDPRLVAGESVAADVVKCTLKPVDPGDYQVAFTDAQRQRLASIFPDGVCDWSAPGVGQQPAPSTWPRFGP